MMVRSPLLNLQGNPHAEAIQAARDKHFAAGARLRKSDHLLLAFLMERCVLGGLKGGKGTGMDE